MLKIGLQLWSIKDFMEKDFFGTLTSVAAMGYDGVEFAGYYGYTAQEIKSKLDKLGLQVAGSHIQFEQLQHHLDEVIEFEKALGNKYVVCPYANFETEEKWRDFFKELSRIGRKLKEAGLQLVYHNHNHEFEQMDGKIILDEMLSSVSEEDLKIELDTYWSEYAGVVYTPSWMRNNNERLLLIHLKDMKAHMKESTEIGNGILLIQKYVDVAKEIGTEWVIIEQEAFTQDSLESVKLGLNNLKKII